MKTSAFIIISIFYAMVSPQDTTNNTLRDKIKMQPVHIKQAAKKNLFTLPQ